MQINYDPQTNTAYIKLADGEYKISRKVSDDIIIDYDKNENPLGIEILSANEISFSISNGYTTSVNRSLRDAD